MQTVATTGAPTGRTPAYADVVQAFQEVGEAIVQEVELDRLLHLVLRKVCALIDVRRGSLYLVEERTGLFRGQVGFMGDQEVDDQVKRLTCGVPADQFTAEILETRAPVLISDAPHDPRPVRSVVRDWSIRSILGVPMVVGGEVHGLMFLDDLERPHDFTATQQQLTSAFADMAAVAIRTASRAEALATSAKLVARQNTLLRKAVAMEGRLTTLALRGGDVPAVVAKLAELIDAPCAVYDSRFSRVAVAPVESGVGPSPMFDEPARSEPEIRATLDGLPDEPSVVGPFPRVGIQRRCLIVPIMAHEERRGHLVVTEAAARLTVMESLVASRAAAIIALGFTFQRRSDQTERYAREALVRRLLDGGAPAASLVARAEFHGIRQGASNVVVLLAGSPDDETPWDGMTIEAAAERVGFSGVLLGGASQEAVTLIVELPAADNDVPARFGELLRVLGASVGGRAAISGVCTTVEALPSAYQDARQVLQILETFATSSDSPRILSVDELGAGFLLLSTTTLPDAERFVTKVLGDIADGRGPKSIEALHTLETFLASGCGIRRTATRLHVHENTVRYRLTRLAEGTGRDLLADPHAHFEAQVALQVLRLQGRLPAPEPDVSVAEAAEPAA